MQRIHLLTGIVLLLWATAGRAEAQTITLIDNNGPRASLRVGYGGHGIDWESSIDSPLLADVVRLRGGLGWGRWDSDFDSYENPIVTRLAGSALVFIRTRNDLKPYLGLGVSAYFPWGMDIKNQTGTRLILGAEASGDRWTVGVEVELDVPRDRRSVDGPRAGTPLYLVGRIGLAVRRHF